VSKQAVRRWGPTGAAVASRDGRVLELWSFVGASASDFDWGDETFPTTFETQPHHGNTADVYRRWVGAAASVVEQVQEHGWDSVRREDARQVRDVFLGSEPPRIVLRADGSKPVVESRHRVLAAIQQGAAIPVLVVRLPGPGSAPAASSCPACLGSQGCRDCGGSGRTKTLGIAESLEGLGLETVPERICPACGGSGRCPCCPTTTPEKR
jgi:hypothetical protein